ncbi:hypothetical protein [Streptomyces tateyamensis]|uniref:hypothetical protein n=1 Tax=Streptomyces tateyamensis TaxID=565073 RepID=UPI0015E8E546|nr:hypothetical protein [Streptomyces tateyamensis]
MIHLGTQPYDGPLPVAEGHDLTARGLQHRAAGEVRWVSEGVWSWTPAAEDGAA